MATRPKAIIESHDGEEFSPITIAKNVLTDDGQNLQDILSDKKEDMMTPTIENSSSMFKVGQGDNVDYSENVVDGAYESCVLKGKSLVNVVDYDNREFSGNNTISNNGVITLYATGGYSNTFLECVYLKPNTKYLAIVDVLENTLVGEENARVTLTSRVGSSIIEFNEDFYISIASGVGRQYKILRTVENPNCKWSFRSFLDSNSTGGYIKYKVMMIEYQEGMENWDLDYFEGLCDVKSPILRNTGKNLFNIDGEFIKSGYSNGIPIISHPSSQQTIEKIGGNTFRVITPPNSYNTGYGQFINVRGLDHITLSCSSIFSNSNTFIEIKVLCMYQGEELLTTVDYETSKSYINRVTTLSLSTSNQEYSTNIYVAPYDRIFVSFTGNWKSEMSGTFEFTMNDVYIRELLDNNEDYEPYKSNTTTFSTDDDKTIVLRSLPNGVCDTLNVETGEYVQRIGEYVANGGGDEIWELYKRDNYSEWTTYQWKCKLTSLALGFSYKDQSSRAICDKLKFGTVGTDLEEDYEHYRGIGADSNGNSSHFYIWLNQTKATTVEELKTHLQQDPITIQYQLAKPITKTVDISGYPFAYKNGHVQLSSGSIEQSLTPTIEYSVATNRNGQVRSNQKMVERHQKELDHLQAMVLANMVETQYRQTLMKLKNDLKSEVRV